MITPRMWLRRATCNHWRSQITVSLEVEKDGKSTTETTTTCQYCGKVLGHDLKTNT